MKRILVLTLVITLFLSMNAFAVFLTNDNVTYYDIKKEPGESVNMMDGTDAIKYITVGKGVEIGQYTNDDGETVQAIKLDNNGDYVEFYTSNATAFTFMCDQEKFDISRVYTLSVFENGILKSVISDFNSKETNTAKYIYNVRANSKIRLVYNCQSITNANNPIEPLYVFNAVFN